MRIAAACHEVRAGDAGGKFFRGGSGVAKGKPATLRFIIHRPRNLNCSTFFVWGILKMEIMRKSSIEMDHVHDSSIGIWINKRYQLATPKKHGNIYGVSCFARPSIFFVSYSGESLGHHQNKECSATHRKMETWNTSESKLWARVSMGNLRHTALDSHIMAIIWYSLS